MIKLLVKNRLRSIFRSTFMRSKNGAAAKPNKGKIVLFSILYLYIAVVFVAMFGGVAVSLGAALIPLNAGWLYYALMMLLSFAIVFILSVFETKSEIFESKDNELLLAMPIRPSAIVASRISVVLIYNYIECAAIMFPTVAVYAYFTGFDVPGVIGGIVAFLLIPLLATTFASAVGYAVALLSRRVGNRSYITVAISLAFLAFYIYGYTKISANMSKYIESLVQNIEIIEDRFSFLIFFGNVGLLSPIPTLVFAVITAAASILAYYLISASYVGVVTSSTGVAVRAYKEKRVRRGSVTASLVKKEIKKFTTSASYMLNGGLGLLFEIIAGVAVLLKRGDIADVLIGLGLPSSITIPVMLALIVIFNSITMISVSSLSLEGENLWILKTLPISPERVVLAKALPQIIISAVPNLITSLLLFIASGASAAYLPLFILLPQIASAAFSFFGLILNIALPKFKFTNEVEVIKQSMAVLIYMFSGMLFALADIAAALVLSFVDVTLAIVAVTLIPAITCVVCGVILFGHSTRKYARLDV